MGARRVEAAFGLYLPRRGLFDTRLTVFLPSSLIGRAQASAGLALPITPIEDRLLGVCAAEGPVVIQFPRTGVDRDPTGAKLWGGCCSSP